MSVRRAPGYPGSPPDDIAPDQLCDGTGRPTTGRCICPRTHGGCPSCHAYALPLDEHGNCPPHEPHPEPRRPVRRER